MQEDEQRRLKKFLKEFKELIDDVLKNEHEHWFPPGVLKHLQEAWEEVSQEIPTIQSAIDDPSNQRRLDDVGFTGDQLTAKMAAWDSRRRLRWWESALAWLRPLQGALKVANGILGSIVDATGLPAARAVEEIKKIVEGALDIGDGSGQVKKAWSWIKGRFRRS